MLPAALIIPMRSCQTINFFSFNYDKPPFCCGFEPSSHGYLIKIASPLGIPFFTVRNKNTLFFFIGMAFIPLPPTFGGRAIRKYFFCGFPYPSTGSGEENDEGLQKGAAKQVAHLDECLFSKVPLTETYSGILAKNSLISHHRRLYGFS